MAISALRLRTGAIVAAAGLMLAGLAAAAPAHAADAPVISLDQTSFPAGDWEGGFTVTGSGFAPGVAAELMLSVSSGPSSGGSSPLGSIVPDASGNISIAVAPTDVTTLPTATGYPKYAVGATQSVGGENVYSNFVELTITAGTSITLPTAVSPESLAAGITISFAGFAPYESISYYYDLYSEGAFVPVDGFTTADATGAGSFVATAAGAKVGDSLEVGVFGEESERQALVYARITEAPAPVPAPAPAPAAPAAAAGTGLAETGVDLGIGFAALAFLVLGAGAVFMTRRVRAAQR